MGLSLSYALPITGLLNGLLTSTAEAEQEMVAVERMLEFSRITPQVRKNAKQHQLCGHDVPAAFQTGFWYADGEAGRAGWAWDACAVSR